MMRRIDLLYMCLLALFLPAVLCDNYYDDSKCNGKIRFEEKLSDVAVKCGTEVNRNTYFADGGPYSNTPPEIKFSDADATKYYTLIMADPDAPNHLLHSLRSYLHYLVINIKGSDLAEGKLNGEVIKGYMPPTPPKHSGFHRYFTYLFEQSEKLNKFRKPYLRGRFDVKKWAKDHGLGFIAAKMFKTKLP